MSKPSGYFCGYQDSAIEQFAQQFEKGNNDCALAENDQMALVAVLAQHAFCSLTGLEEDFYTNVESAIGDGVETSMEAESDDAPLAIALSILQHIQPKHCYGLIAYLVQ